MKKLLATLAALVWLMLPAGGALARDMYDSPQAVFDGVNLTGELTGDEIEMTLVYQSEDRTNFAEYLVDGAVIASYERLAPVGDMEGALALVRELLAGQGMEMQDVAIAPCAAVGNQPSGESYCVDYSLGGQEDELVCRDVFVRTDEWSYRFHTLTPADLYADYQDRIGEWMASLRLEEMDSPARYDAAEDPYPRLAMPLSGDQLELTEYEQYSAIEYEQWYAYDGGAVLLSYERYLPCADSLTAVTEATTGMYESVSGLTGARDEALTASLGHPAYRVEYLTGDGISTWQNVDVFVLDEDCALCFHVETADDVYEEYQQVIDSWIGALCLENTGA